MWNEDKFLNWLSYVSGKNIYHKQKKNKNQQQKAAKSLSWLDHFVSGPGELHSHWMIHVWHLGALEIFSIERVELLN